MALLKENCIYCTLCTSTSVSDVVTTLYEIGIARNRALLHGKRDLKPHWGSSKSTHGSPPRTGSAHLDAPKRLVVIADKAIKMKDCARAK